MKCSEDRETLDKSETKKILKSKDPRMEPWGTPERTARDEKRGKGLYIGSINKFPPFDKQWRYQYVIVQIVSCKTPYRKVGHLART